MNPCRTRTASCGNKRPNPYNQISKVNTPASRRLMNHKRKVHLSRQLRQIRNRLSLTQTIQVHQLSTRSTLTTHRYSRSQRQSRVRAGLILVGLCGRRNRRISKSLPLLSRQRRKHQSNQSWPRKHKFKDCESNSSSQLTSRKSKSVPRAPSLIRQRETKHGTWGTAWTPKKLRALSDTSTSSRYATALLRPSTNTFNSLKACSSSETSKTT